MPVIYTRCYPLWPIVIVYIVTIWLFVVVFAALYCWFTVCDDIVVRIRYCTHWRRLLPDDAVDIVFGSFYWFIVFITLIRYYYSWIVIVILVQLLPTVINPQLLFTLPCVTTFDIVVIYRIHIAVIVVDSFVVDIVYYLSYLQFTVVVTFTHFICCWLPFLFCCCTVLDTRWHDLYWHTFVPITHLLLHLQLVFVIYYDITYSIYSQYPIPLCCVVLWLLLHPLHLYLYLLYIWWVIGYPYLVLTVITVVVLHLLLFILIHGLPFGSTLPYITHGCLYTFTVVVICYVICHLVVTVITFCTLWLIVVVGFIYGYFQLLIQYVIYGYCTFTCWLFTFCYLCTVDHIFWPPG